MSTPIADNFADIRARMIALDAPAAPKHQPEGDQQATPASRELGGLYGGSLLGSAIYANAGGGGKAIETEGGGADIANKLRGLIHRALKAGANKETMRIILDHDTRLRLLAWATSARGDDPHAGTFMGITILQCADDLEPRRQIISLECSPVISVFE